MSVLKLIASKNFITVNKDVVKAVGINEAIILGAMCSELVLCDSLGRTTEDGFFPFSIELLQEETTLGRKSQDTAIANLMKAGLIEQKNFGIPNKRHFRIVENEVKKILVGQTSLDSADTQVCSSRTNCDRPKEQTIISNKDSKKDSNKECVINNIFTQADKLIKDEIQGREFEILDEIVSAWNKQKNIRTKIERVPPLSKRYNDIVLCIQQFGYERFLYEILSLDNNKFFEQWKPNFDWFIDPNNFLKVTEGTYRFATKKEEVDKYSKEYWDSL